MRYIRVMALLCALIAPASAFAQAESNATEGSGAVNVASDVLPAGALIALEVSEAISSKSAKPGDLVSLVLAEPLTIGGVLLAPVGSPVRGEVIHSSPARLGGKSGELTLAARSLQIGDRSVRLRALQIVAAGKDRTNGASILMIAGALATPVGGLAAFLVKGGDVEVPVGAVGVAKLAEPLGAPAAAPTPHQATPSKPE